MSESMITVERRAETGKSAIRKLRNRELVPAVLYGAGRESVPIQVSRKLLLDLFKKGGHENRIFLLKLAGTEQSRHAMVRDMQLNPLTDEVIHLDFQRIDMDEKLRVTVRVELLGTPTGVKNEGGVLDFVTRELEVECLPSAIPGELTIDVSGLHIGDHVEASAVELPEGVEYVGVPDAVIVSVKHSRVDAAAEEAEEGAEEAVEPEVIGKGKEDEDEEAEES